MKPKVKPRAVPKARPKPKPKGKTMVTEKHEPPKAPPPPPPHAAGKPADVPAVKPDDVKTEQEKGAKDPVEKSQPLGTKAESIEDLGIGPREPYPDGNPPKPKTVADVHKDAHSGVTQEK